MKFNEWGYVECNICGYGVLPNELCSTGYEGGAIHGSCYGDMVGMTMEQSERKLCSLYMSENPLPNYAYGYPTDSSEDLDIF